MYTRERFNSCLYSRLDLAKNGTDRGNRARTEGTRAEPSPPESKFVRIRFSSEDRSSMQRRFASSLRRRLRRAYGSTEYVRPIELLRHSPLSLSFSSFARLSLFSLSLARAGYTVVAPALSHPKSLSLSSKFFNPFDRTTSRSVSKRARLLSLHSGRDYYLFICLFTLFVYFSSSFVSPGSTLYPIPRPLCHESATMETRSSNNCHR